MIINKTETVAIIPCYKVKSKIKYVIKKSLNLFDLIICVDDNCPENSGNKILKEFKNKKIVLIKKKSNSGVGGAFKTGLNYCKKINPKVIVKIDGDNQISPGDAKIITERLLSSNYDYVVGNRFKSNINFTAMPLTRWYGNKFISYFSKICSGLYHIDDFLNGLIAIKYKTLKKINLNDIKNDFRFETSFLFNISKKNLKVGQIPMKVKYFKNKSNFVVRNEYLKFLKYNFYNFIQRIIIDYIKRPNLGTIALFFSFTIFFIILINILFYYKTTIQLIYLFVFFTTVFFILDISARKGK
jgi:dolichol-phosphate mannosyltransferase